MIHQNSLKNLKRGRKDSEVECEFCNKLIKKPYIKRHSEKKVVALPAIIAFIGLELIILIIQKMVVIDTEQFVFNIMRKNVVSVILI